MINSKLSLLLGMAAIFGCSAPADLQELDSLEAEVQELTKPSVRPVTGPCRLSARRGNAAGKNKFVGILYIISFDQTILPSTSSYPWTESEMVRPRENKSYDL